MMKNIFSDSDQAASLHWPINCWIEQIISIPMKFSQVFFVENVGKLEKILQFLLKIVESEKFISFKFL